MSYKKFDVALKILLSLYVWHLYVTTCTGHEFDRNYFGVVFRPYVKQFEDGVDIPSLESYTSENVKTMLKVISTKFSKVMVIGEFAQSAKYIFNHTYYHESYIDLYSGEIAAQINKENKRKILTIIFSVTNLNFNNETLAEIDLVLEAAEKANKIFPGSVEGIIIDGGDNEFETNQGLSNLKSAREKTTSQGIKLGLEPACTKVLPNASGVIPDIGRKIVEMSDFVICALESNSARIKPIFDQVFSYQQVATSVRSTAEVIFRLKLADKKSNARETVNDLKVFWETASEWSVSKKAKIYLSEAFDAPVMRIIPGNNDAYRGWWKLTDNSKISSIDGYVEKVTDRYEYNVTYHKSLASIRSGEVAAMLNRMNGTTHLTLTYYVYNDESLNKVETEFMLACEAAEKANKIFPGTVSGVTVETMNLTWKFQELLRRRASSVKIKFGAAIECELLLASENHTVSKNLRKNMKLWDFIACDMDITYELLGPTFGFRNSSATLSSVKDTVDKISPGTSTKALTGWSSSGQYPWSTLENQRIFWEAASKWAAQEKVQIFLAEAIDNPHRGMTEGKEDGRHLGWWKLENARKINSVDGYVEKVSELPGYCVPKPPSYQTTSDNNTEVAWTTAHTLGVTFGCIIILFMIAHLVVRFRKRITTLTSDDIREFFHGGLQRSSDESTEMTASNRSYDQTLEIAKNKIRLGSSIIGSGEFGLAYKAQVEFEEGEIVDVAIKVPKDNCPSATLKGMLSEIKIMSYLGHHANIVALVGAYAAELTDGVVYVLTEFCSLGSLESYLRKNKAVALNEKRKSNADCQLRTDEVVNSSLISFSSMLRWGHEISCGMEYLTSKHVVHADLATRNVLLTSLKTAKISDFGLSRRMLNYSNYIKRNQEPLPWRWMAFESLDRMEFSSKSDVWSYGITLWEIFSKGSIPYSGLRWTHGFNKDLLDGLRPDCPFFATPEIFELMQNCWTLEAADRPCFSEISCLTHTLFQKDFDMENEEESAYLPIREIE